MLRDRAVGRHLLAVVVVAASVAIAIGSLSAITSSEAVGVSDVPGGVAQASSEVGLLPPASRLFTANPDASTPDPAGVGLFAVLVAGAAVLSLPARRQSSQHTRSSASLQQVGSSEPRAPPVAPAV